MNNFAVTREEFLALFTAASFLGNLYQTEDQPTCEECVNVLALLICDTELATDLDILHLLQQGPERIAETYKTLANGDTGYALYQEFMRWDAQLQKTIVTRLETGLQRIISGKHEEVFLLKSALEERVKEHD